MRCIEIDMINMLDDGIRKININMRCIEIITHMSLAKLAKRININMRCIEIDDLLRRFCTLYGLTLT